MIRLYVLAISVLLIACSNGKDKPDVSDIKADVRIERLEPTFFSMDTNHMAQGLMHLRNAYPNFYPDFMQNILGVNPMDTSSFVVIKNIISSYKNIYDSLEKKYENLNWLQEELTTGFKYVKYYYPTYKLPAVITYVGTFDAPGIVLTREYLGIGLHQFAGKNFSVYQSQPVQEMYPVYISRRFDKEYMTASCLKAIVDDVYPDRSTGRPLIEQMIEKGKQWYILDHFLPDAADSIKTGYTKKQLEWANENEGNIWGYLVKNENLYAIEPTTIQTYIGEAPFTQGMPESSPGNLGQWVGWKIVQAYAEKNKNLTLQQLVQTEPKVIFEEAQYKPK